MRYANIFIIYSGKFKTNLNLITIIKRLYMIVMNLCKKTKLFVNNLYAEFLINFFLRTDLRGEYKRI